MNNDLISRSALKAQIKQAGWLDALDGSVAVFLANTAPAVDAAPVVHGRWVDTGLENSTGKIIKCSACGRLRNPNENDVALGRIELHPLYCDACGARMDGGEDDE